MVRVAQGGLEHLLDVIGQHKLNRLAHFFWYIIQVFFVGPPALFP